MADSRQFSAEQRDAQRQDARRMLDRIIQLDRGEPVDTSSDDVGTTFRLREFVEADPEEQARRRDRLRQLAAPSPPPAPTEFERRIARVLDGIRPVDGGNPSNPFVAKPGENDADADFLITQLARLEKKSADQPQDKILREKLVTTGRVHNLVAGSDRQGLQRFLDLYRNAIDGTGKDIADLNRELDKVLSTARDLDNSLVKPFLASSILQNLIDLDPEGLGPDLGFVAQIVSSGPDGTSPGFEAASPLAPGARLGGIRP